MKKNVMMRVASLLMVCVLATTCGISGTFAKYVTKKSSEDTARVAKWGVRIEGYANLFEQSYDTTDGSFTLSGKTVVSNADEIDPAGTDDVLAPGTDGTLTGFAVTGTPEVAVRVSYTVDTFKMENWAIDGGSYCPIIFSIAKNGGAAQKYFIGDGNATDVDSLMDEVKAAIVACGTDYQANTDLSEVQNDLSISWAWEFDGATGADDQDDIKDTELGDWDLKGKEAPSINLKVTCTVEQID